tara:strand:+ start:39 stop:812 length:774 start_codon:yes stop_codon:yes gene_type:complete
MSGISDIKKRIKQLKNQLAIEYIKLEKAVADVLDPTKECCGVIYDKISEYNRHRDTKKCKINRKVPNFRCKICNTRFFDGYNSLDELFADNPAYMKSTYRKHIMPMNNPNPCRTYCDTCDVQLTSLYMAQKHRDCSKNKKKLKVASEAETETATEAEAEAECPPAYSPKIKKKFKVKKKKEPLPSPVPSSDSEGDLSHFKELKLDNYLYYHNTITDAIYDAMDEYQGQAIIDDFDNIHGIDRTYDKPPKLKSSIKYI